MKPSRRILLIVLPLFFLCGCVTYRNVGLVRHYLYPKHIQNPTALGDNTLGQSMDHRIWTELLAASVGPDDRVDYGEFATRSTELASYMKQLGKTPIAPLSRHEQAALYINAYNAFTIQLMLDYPDVGSIKDIPSAKRWDDARWQLDRDRQLSLNQIEHQILRPEFADPRLHFALVCASTGCPRLRNEAYTGADLDRQLEEQAIHFFGEPRNLRWDESNKTLQVSELLDWFRSDFADSTAGLLERIRPWLPPEIPEGDLRITWLPYDWTINGPR